MMDTCEVNGVVLGLERFGESTAPPVLCLGAPTMLSWPDALCESLSDRGRHVVRCDLRGSGASTRGNPEAPDYTLRDLAADAAALAACLSSAPAHLAGIGISGMVAQVAALDHPGAFSALTLIGSRPVAPGPVDEDLPDHDDAAMGRLFSQTMPEWTDIDAVADHAAEGARVLGNDPEEARRGAMRIWQRTRSADGKSPSSDPAAHMADQLGMVFSRLDCRPRWRERLPDIGLPTLVVHGRQDPFFPVGNGEALAREIPNSRLLVLDEAATAIPAGDIAEVAKAMASL
ncbi:alpha/beta fold hydrolase [Brevibacterium oceani]|uniref:alpha/beta fold hydrolase n=1 Tax=Brevibacterium oceani TaxID=358099 RepID=UPI002159C5E9|nr:alpha/beta hydrolase [Brevibacterium oceani]